MIREGRKDPGYRERVTRRETVLYRFMDQTTVALPVTQEFKADVGRNIVSLGNILRDAGPFDCSVDHLIATRWQFDGISFLERRRQFPDSADLVSIFRSSTCDSCGSFPVNLRADRTLAL